MVSKEYFGEDKKIEFKQEIPSKHEKFLKDIIAFANTSGGKSIIGIVDETKEVVGIGDQSPFKLSDSISSMISDSCTPLIETDIYPQSVEGKTVLVVEVFPGKHRPYYLANKTKEDTSYVRVNGTSRPADPVTLKELELEGSNLAYDSMQEIGLDYDENKALELCRVVKEIALSNCETEDEKLAVKDMTIGKLEDMGVLCRSGRDLAPTHAFSLLTDNHSRFAKIQCALFKGNDRDLFIDKKEYEGPIYEQMSDAFQFILKHINIGAKVDGLYSKDVYELPIKSIRELVANAVIHRSYLVESKIQISIFDDRIEVVSPGMLYGGMDIATMKTGRSKCRNQAIADMFQYMHIVEAWGTGIPRIIKSCKQYGLQEPVFEEFGDGIKVTVYRLNTAEAVEQANKRIVEQANKRTSEQANSQTRNKTSETRDKIKEFLETVNDASSAEIAEAIGLSQSRTRAILSEMADEIETTGSTSNRRYRKKK
ncbi:MAG: putative DNA binding domain-containing protein [Butyrivibrio sp.]|nr:putative DNA binding domain-containing protein [Butyrivibrio sp.]